MFIKICWTPWVCLIKNLQSTWVTHSYTCFSSRFKQSFVTIHVTLRSRRYVLSVNVRNNFFVLFYLLVLRLAQNVSRCECWGKRSTANWQLFIRVFRVLLSYRFDCFRISSHEMFVFSYGVFIFQFATAWYCKCIQTIIVITFQSILPEVSHTSKQFSNLLYSKNL